MRLNQTRLYQRGEGTYSILTVPTLRPMWVMERKWRENTPDVSCVPTGFYSLVPHDGEKYKDTWALVGATVSHRKEPGIPRSFCVAHWEDDPKFLEGCLSMAYQLGPDGRLYDSGRNALTDAKCILAANPGPHYLNITAAPGYLASAGMAE